MLKETYTAFLKKISKKTEGGPFEKSFTFEIQKKKTGFEVDFCFLEPKTVIGNLELYILLKSKFGINLKPVTKKIIYFSYENKEKLEQRLFSFLETYFLCFFCKKKDISFEYSEKKKYIYIKCMACSKEKSYSVVV